MSSTEETRLCFGVGTGRSATMAISNALNSELQTLVLHEGKVREMSASGVQHLPFLTLENRLAYEYPHMVESIISDLRSIDKISSLSNGRVCFGDIAYNYSPLVGGLKKQFPLAKIIFFYRDCIPFVRSCTTITNEDETPVGWPPSSREMTDLELYISYGRLQPKEGTEDAKDWPKWDYLKKNVWLWCETNRIILEQIELFKSDVFFFKFEDFKIDPIKTYNKLRVFLGFNSELSFDSHKLLHSKINQRKVKEIPEFNRWPDGTKKFYEERTFELRKTLKYV